MKDNLKRYLCNKLIQENLVKEGDFIRHSYTKNRLNKMYTQNSVCPDTCPTLDTRCDCLGVVVNDMIINPLKDKSPYGWHFEQNVYDVNGETRSVKASQGSGNMLKIIEENEMENNLRIRKLTPKECFRLMGVKDEDSDKLNHLSNATKYHLAGDSIVVNTLQAIFKSILLDNPVVEEKPIRLIEFFAGYGSQALALKYLGIPFEHWKTCEWAVKSINAYRHIHFPNEYHPGGVLDIPKEELIDFLYKKGISSNWNEPMKLESIKRMKESDLYQTYEDIYVTNNLVNIQQVHAEDLEIKERDNYNYILTYSFPCQDLSLAGKTAGMKKGSGTRSGMLWEVERILEECSEELPQILLMENVPQVVGKKNKEDFDKWLEFLESKGYTNKYCMLNAKEVGYPEPIPQNRNRCFMVSVLNPKQDIIFPEKTERKTVLKDLLEEQVDEKYYLSDKMLNCFMSDGTGSYPRRERFLQNINRQNQDVGNSVTTLAGSRATDNFVVNNKALQETLETNEVKQDVSYVDSYNKKIREDDITGTITTRVDASNNSYLLIKNATKQGYLEATEGDGVNIGSRMQYQRGNVQKGMIQTITTSGGTDRGVVTNTTSEDKWSDLD